MGKEAHLPDAFTAEQGVCAGRAEESDGPGAPGRVGNLCLLCSRVAVTAHVTSALQFVSRTLFCFWV